MARRVVVTGVGLVTPVGHTADDTFENLCQGKSGIRRVPALADARFGDQPLEVFIGGEVGELDTEGMVEKKEAKRMDPFILQSHVAAVQAWRQAGLPERLDNAEGERGGTLVGVGLAGVNHIYAAWETLKEKGARRISPLFVPSIIGNLAPGHIGMRFNLRGPNWTPASAGASGSQAIGEAMVHILDGRCDLMVAGGAESVVTPIVIAGFDNMGALTHEQDDPATACRPFDQGRSGAVLGEGAGILILEELERAVARGAPILCEVVGFGLGQDEGVPNVPQGMGMRHAIERALEQAGMKPADIGYVNAHGIGQVEADRTEARALREVFGDASDRLAVSSIKGATGDLLGGSGAVEGVVTAMAVARGRIPPTVNLDKVDPECGPFHFVQGKAEDKAIDAAMSVNFGVGGANTALIFKRYPS